MKKYIVVYKTDLLLDNKIEYFSSFDKGYLETKFKYKDEFSFLSLREFKNGIFDDDDIIILSLVNRLPHNFFVDELVSSILTLFGHDNFHRKNTFLIMGTGFEAHDNGPRTKENITIEEAADIIYERVGKADQEVKLLLDGAETYGRFAVQNNKTHRISANMLPKWVGDLMAGNGSFVPGNNIYRKNIKKIKEKTSREKLFTCLQRRPRQCRLINLYNILRLDLNNDSYFSLNCENVEVVPEDTYMYWKHVLTRENDWLIKTGNIEQEIQNFNSFLPQMLTHGPYKAGDGVDLDENQAYNLMPEHYLNSYFNVIAETRVSSGFVFLTEKLWKSVICGNPFFVLGNPGYLKTLRDKGYKTFDNWWDESYDDEESHWERSKMVFSILNDLKNKSKEELNEMLYEQLEVIEHNRKHLYNSMIVEDTWLEDVLDLQLNRKQ
jgi:hypothetical protein